VKAFGLRIILSSRPALLNHGEGQAAGAPRGRPEEEEAESSQPSLLRGGAAHEE